MPVTRLGKPPEREYEAPSQDILPTPKDCEAHPEGVIELDSQAEARWWAHLNEQRAQVTDARSYVQSSDKLVTSSMVRSRESISSAWMTIQNEAAQHIREVTEAQRQSPPGAPEPRIQPFIFNSNNNFRCCTGASTDNLIAAVATLWMYRWLCGAFPYNPSISGNYMSEAQYGAVLMEETGFSSIDRDTGYSDHPALPVVSCMTGRLHATMTDEQYEYSRKAIGSGMGFVSSPPQPLSGMIHSFMDDSDPIDVGSLAHRRWLLSPGMKSTGFGAYYSSSLMYALGSPQNNAEHMGDFIAYPAPGWFPSSWLRDGTAWSIAINPDRFWIAPNATVTVYQTHTNEAPCGCNVPPVSACPLHRRGEQLPAPYEESFSRINRRGFGGSPCIIFRPQGVNTTEGQSYEVVVQGLWAAGERITLRYIVTFFDF